MNVKRMKNKKDILHPDHLEHVREIAQDELRAIRIMLLNQWHWVLLSLLGLIVLLYFFNPLPPSKIVLASGQANSSLEVWAKRYQQYFLDAGVNLELVPTKGAQENIELINQKKVHAALSQGGMPVSREGIYSLGSIGFMPLWLFYRADGFDDPNQFLEKKKISVNVPGSGTHRLIETILAQHELKIGQQSNFIELPSVPSVKELLAGKIDAVALVAGMESGNVQSILKDPSIKIYDFGMARAYEKHLDFIEVVNVPRGAIDMKPITPQKDVAMPATTTVLLVDEDLHPAIQYLFLKASKDLNKEYKPFFNRPGGFPAYLDPTVPESEIAERFYEHGLFPLDRFVPFWLASFLDRAWFYLVAALAVVYPLMRISPQYRLVDFKLSLDRAYAVLKSIEKEVERSHAIVELEAQSDALNQLIHSTKKLWVPIGCKESYFQLMQNIGIVEAEIAKKLEEARSAE